MTQKQEQPKSKTPKNREILTGFRGRFVDAVVALCLLLGFLFVAPHIGRFIVRGNIPPQHVAGVSLGLLLLTVALCKWGHLLSKALQKHKKQ
jgi:hypothetical protein